MSKSCTYCGSSRSIQGEHVIAQSKQRSSRNTIPACAACNRSKGSKPFMEWLRWIKKNDNYRWNRISDYNSGRRSEIAKKVQKVRDE